MLSICPHPGCPEMTEGGLCGDLRAQRRRQSEARMRGRGWQRPKRWAKFRAAYLTKHPRCVECHARANTVHHLDGLGPMGPRGFDEHNCAAMCTTCHSKLTAIQAPGGWHSP
jgi:5-methylcytosine-specific restriction protein A